MQQTASHPAAGISAVYFDGKTSRPHPVRLRVENGQAIIEGDAIRSCPLEVLRVSERSRRLRRRVTFPDGAYLEALDAAAFDALLHSTGHRDSLVVNMQQSWRATLAAIAALLLVLAAGYVFVLPLASEAIAKALPERIERTIGRGTLEMLDERMLAPSALPSDRREAIVARFRSLTPPREGAPAYEIVFRKSRIGPNAFALPSGQIVLTDEIVRLVDDDDAIVAILSHEVGHLHERHLLRRIVQSSVIGAAAAVLFGDVSSTVAGIPVLLLDLKYSRDAEREADDYAIAMLKANGIPPSRLAVAFEKLGGNNIALPPYLSTHPPTAERVDRIRSLR